MPKTRVGITNGSTLETVQLITKIQNSGIYFLSQLRPRSEGLDLRTEEMIGQHVDIRYDNYETRNDRSRHVSILKS